MTQELLTRINEIVEKNRGINKTAGEKPGHFAAANKKGNTGSDLSTDSTGSHSVEDMQPLGKVYNKETPPQDTPQNAPIHAQSDADLADSTALGLGVATGAGAGGLGGYYAGGALGMDKTLATLAGMFGGGGMGFLMAHYLINKHQRQDTEGAGANAKGVPTAANASVGAKAQQSTAIPSLKEKEAPVGPRV